MVFKKFDRRGQMRVIETLIASFIIVAALSFVGVFAVSPTSSSYEVTDLEKMAYSTLHDLDQQGLLAPAVYSHSWSDLRNILRITMPNDVYFNLTVWKVNGSPIYAGSEILYGSLNTFSEARNVVSISYCLVGTPKFNGNGVQTAEYEPLVLVLEVTRG
jgi:diphthamide synthase subunit DPH2